MITVQREFPSYEFDAMFDIADRWGISYEEAEVFLDETGYYEWASDGDGDD